MDELTIATEQEHAGAALQGLRIAFVGKLGGVNRKQARALVRRLGGTMVDRLEPGVDWVVVGADVIPLEDPDDLAADWVAEAVGQQQLKVLNETEFWQEIGVVENEADVSQLYTPAMLASLLEVPVSTIRRWHRRGLISPARQVKKLPYFDFQEVASARRIATLIASGANPTTIETKLSRLSELYPHLQRPLAQLSIIVEGSRLLLRREEGLIEPDGQMRIDFDALEHPDVDTEPESATTFSFLEAVLDNEDPVDSSIESPAQLVELANQLEDEGQYESAIEVYRLLALAEGPTPENCFRLAELLYQTGDPHGARERYFMAVELAPDFVEARANLGCVLVELGQNELARSAFEGALEHHREYPDVHFHFARLLDEMGFESDADQHWKKFLELTPHSPWAAEARTRLLQVDGEPLLGVQEFTEQAPTDYE